MSDDDVLVDALRRLDAMLKDASRRKFDVTMVWAIDRLGRSLIDLTRAAASG